METTDKPEYVLARETLSAIVSAAGIVADAVPMPRNYYGEHAAGIEPLQYSVILTQHSVLLHTPPEYLQCEYSAGHGVPLADYCANPFPVRPDNPMALPYDKKRLRSAAAAHRCAVADAAMRYNIRRTWRPSAVDIVAALLSDVASLQGCTDALEWGESLGMLPAEDAAAVRRIYRMHAEIVERAPILRRMLGANYSAAEDAAMRL